MTRAKVLHLITLSVVGGSQDNTFCTAEGHDRNRYEVHLACNPYGQWADRARRAAERFHALPTLVTPVRPLCDLRALWDIIGLLRRERFDVVHTHTAKAGFLGRLAAKLCGVPCVVHTYHAFPFHDHMPAWKRSFYVWLERVVRPLTNAFITVSEKERELGQRARVLRWKDSHTVYSGIDFSKLDQPRDARELRRELAIPEDHAVILMAGRFDAQKAPHLMIEAFKKVVDRHPRALLLMAGDGELRPLVEQTIARLGLPQKVRLLGFRSDVPDLIRLADIFALSSLWEGLGRAMTEAMLLAKPVVVPNTNGIPDIVEDRKTGLLYPTGDVDGLASQINWLLDNPREQARLGEQARQRTRRLFGVDEMIDRIEMIYEDLLIATVRPTAMRRPVNSGHSPETLRQPMG